MKRTQIVIASMAVLGLISGSAFAATKHASKQTSNVTTTTTKTTATQSYNRGYRSNVSAMPMQPAPVVTMSPMVDSSQVIMDSMTQNLGRQVHPTPDWFQRIAVIGGVNFDAMFGQRSRGYMGENTRILSLNDAYLNATALVNDWTKAFLSASFNNASPATNVSGTTFLGIAAPLNSNFPGVYSAAYTNNRLDLEQGYITFGNFNCTPFFVQLGKQFQDFGRYQIHPMTRTLAQVLSESLQTSAKVGFLTPIWYQMSLHGSVYTFDNSLNRVNMGHSQNVWGAALGVDLPSDQLGFDLGVGYLSNMTGVNDVAYAITAYEALSNSVNLPGTYNAAVGALNLYADVNSGPFSFGARYTTATATFNPNTLSSQYLQAVASGARPWAADFTAGYAFNAWCRSQLVYLGYQVSNHAVNLFIPKNRWIVGYGVDVWHNTNLGIEYLHDTGYSSGNNVPFPTAPVTYPGSSGSGNQVHARAAVKFG